MADHARRLGARSGQRGYAWACGWVEEVRRGLRCDGMVVTHVNGYESRPPSGSGAGRPVSMGGVGMDGVRRNLSMSSSGGETVVRNLLLKPKVLLESVVDIL